MSEDIDRLKCETADGGFWERVQEGHEFPLGVLYCVTERCALKCPHCYQVRDGGASTRAPFSPSPRPPSLRGKGEMGSPAGQSPPFLAGRGEGGVGNKRGEGEGAELTLPEIERLLDELVRLEVFKLTITGGEPCLRPDLADIVAAAWRRRFLISLKTSGALLSTEDVRRLRGEGLSALHISLYHVDPDRHDAFVGRKGAWRTAMAAVEAFHGLGGVVVVGTIAMNWNIDGITPLRELCEARGWSLTVDPKINHRNDGDEGPIPLRAAGDELVEVIGKMPNIQGKGPRRSPDDLVCLAGVNTVYIKPDGEVWPCPVMPLSMGNIRESSLADIWTNSPVRKRVLAMRWGDCAKCAACGISRFCQRCPGEAFQEHGNLAREATIDCAMAAAYARIWAGTHPDD